MLNEQSLCAQYFLMKSEKSTKFIHVGQRQGHKARARKCKVGSMLAQMSGTNYLPLDISIIIIEVK